MKFEKMFEIGIAVIIPAYNAEKTLEDSMHSVRVQTEQPYLIVIDDCSEDNTSNIAKKADLFIQNEERKGKAKSVNDVIQLVNHEYVLILDSDTYLERRFIEKLKKKLIGHKYDCGAGTSKFIGRNPFSKKIAKAWSHNKSDWRYNGCCQFFRTEILKKEKYSEDCLVEDEEIYWRFKNKRSLLVDAVAYSEAPNCPKRWFCQKVRWLRGAYQLFRQNFVMRKFRYRDYRFLGGLFFYLGLCVVFSWEIIFSVSYFSFYLIPILLLLTFGIAGFVNLRYIVKPYYKNIQIILYSSLDILLPIYLMFEVVIFNRKFTVKNW